MNNIESQIQVIESASRGEDVRDAIIDALRSLSEASGSGIDTRLDLQSTNPVQNKVLAQKFAVLEAKIVSGGSDITIEDLIEAYNFVGRFFSDSTTAEIFNDYEHNAARGDYAHAEGYKTTANGEGSHAEGYGAVAVQRSAHAENRNTVASGESSHAEGYYTNASGDNSHTEGARTAATNFNGHAEGESTTANGHSAHSEGRNTLAIGQASHAQGTGTQATGESQHVAGKYNATNDNLAEIVGNGSDSNNRSNARTLDWNGNATYAGKVTAGANASNPMDLTTLSQVQALIAALNIPTAVTIDNALDDLSENPVQNSVITSELRAIQNRITSGIESIDVEQAIAANTMITNTLNSAITNMQSTISTSLTNFNNRATALENRFNEIEQQFQALNIVNDTEY